MSTLIPERLAIPCSYLVRNAWTGEILLTSNDFYSAEAFYEDESDRNLEDEIQLIAVLRRTAK